MPRRLVKLAASGAPLLDLASYARPGPGRRDKMSVAEREHIVRTIRRAPEVMVKVLSKGGQDLRAIRRHIDYLRLREDGELAIETDQGERVTGEGAAKALLEDWDLDLEEHRRRAELESGPGRSAKLVHKLMFSMPPGTPAEKILTAVQNFAREEFALKHRYAMVLHTDEPHPHVHLVLKAVSEQGERLHIRKATLRAWRQEFARHLRALGVAANATERAVRGNPHSPKLDGIYRAEQRGESHRTRAQVHAVAGELATRRVQTEPGKARLVQTREAVQRGWEAVSEILMAQGRPELAAEVRRFAAQMRPPRTDREQIAAALRMHLREARARSEERTR